jgi:hypothetical protein
MKLKLKHLTLIALANLFVFTSCTDENENDFTPVVPLGAYENGILISHEGNFGQGNASVSYVSNDLNTVENAIFNNVNSENLGDTAQSIAFNGDLAYIILNVSNKIEVVNRFTFQTVATIDTGLSNPRYMAFANGKGYVTNWGDFSDTTDDVLTVINLQTNTVESTIATSYLPERIVSNNNSLYVATGIFGFGDKVDVINAISNTLTTSITVGTSPNSMQFNASGDLWVLSDTSLDKISTVNNTVLTTLAISSSAKFLSYDNSNLVYYQNGEVYSFPESDTTLPTMPSITGQSFYGMTVIDGKVYGVDAKDFSINGSLEVLNLENGTLEKSIDLGVIPSQVYFN